MENKTKTTSPKGGKRACLCEDGTYSKECCNGELINQGIGQLSDGRISNVINTNTVRSKSNSR
jgi:hypothetical protein